MIKLQVHHFNGIKDIKNTNDITFIFDLEHWLDLLNPQSITASWMVSDGEGEGVETIGMSYGILESLAQTEERISGTVLTAIARKTTQIIWGDFIGFLPSDSERPWVILRAIDNSFWEVETEDQKIVDLVRAKFEDVREVA